MRDPLDLHSVPTRRSSDLGWYLGNPLGLHYQEHVPEGVPITDPAFAGVTGHVRALGVVQAQELFEKIGFQPVRVRSEEHTSELQSLRHLVCRLLLEKKNKS